MSFPAARVTDMHTCPMVTPGLPPIPHVGGPILPTCSTNVLTGGLPQARVTDKCFCVGPVDMIVKGSSSVLVNNLPAARVTDTTTHGGVIITGQPNVLIGDRGGGGGGGGFAAPAIGSKKSILDAIAKSLIDTKSKLLKVFSEKIDLAFQKNDWISVLYLKMEGAAKKEGMLGHSNEEIQAGVISLEKTGFFFKRFPYFGYTLEAKALSLEGSARIGAVKGAGYNAEGSASVGSAKLGFFIGDDENNPWFEIDASGAVLTAEAAAGETLGNDGKLIGVGGQLGAEAAIAEAGGTSEINIPWFGENSISLRMGASGAAGAIGGSKNWQAVRDTETGRLHFGGSLELKVFLGLGGAIDLSYGPKYTNRERSTSKVD